ncbi:hypothetical protein M0R45_036970 [Rubus argutus]|uniref:Uncharacterized protein n=1 Tax=Rubus argutus TaxID=59490 RepID=A0AAW1W1J8_RUBAR
MSLGWALSLAARRGLRSLGSATRVMRTGCEKIEYEHGLGFACKRAWALSNWIGVKDDRRGREDDAAQVRAAVNWARVEHGGCKVWVSSGGKKHSGAKRLARAELHQWWCDGVFVVVMIL